MKRILTALLALLPVLGLLSCAKAEVAPAGPEETPPPEFLWRHSLEPFSAAETARMVRAMGGGRALLLDGALYSFDFGPDNGPVLARYPLTEEGLGQREILAEDCLPEYLLELGGQLYYCNGGALETMAPDGSERRTLRQGEARYLQTLNGLLYFCGEDGRFLELDPETGRERTVLEGPCLYPWLREDALLYQSDKDSCLHVSWPDGGPEDSFPLSPGYAPLGLGDRLYYSSEESLVSLALDGLEPRVEQLPGLLGAVELVPEDGDWVLRWVAERQGKEQFFQVPGTEKQQAAPWQGYRLCDYAGEDGRVDAWYGADGRLRCFVFVDPAGNETSFISGRLGLEAVLPLTPTP